MPTIIRHAESAFNVANASERAAAEKKAASGDYDHPLRDADLTEHGRQQVALLALKARALFPGTTAVFTSPLRRALHTAIPIANALGVDIHIVPALRETRKDVSDVGTPGESLAKEFPGRELEKLPEKWWAEGCTCAETAECLRCVIKRKIEFKLLACEHPSAIFVSHSDFLFSVTEIDLDNAEHASYTPPAMP